MSVFEIPTEQSTTHPRKRAQADDDVPSYKRATSEDFRVDSDADEGDVPLSRNSTIFHEFNRPPPPFSHLWNDGQVSPEDAVKTPPHTQNSFGQYEPGFSSHESPVQSNSSDLPRTAENEETMWTSLPSKFTQITPDSSATPSISAYQSGHPSTFVGEMGGRRTQQRGGDTFGAATQAHALHRPRALYNMGGEAPQNGYVPAGYASAALQRFAQHGGQYSTQMPPSRPEQNEILRQRYQTRVISAHSQGGVVAEPVTALQEKREAADVLVDREPFMFQYAEVAKRVRKELEPPRNHDSFPPVHRWLYPYGSDAQIHEACSQASMEQFLWLRKAKDILRTWNRGILPEVPGIPFTFTTVVAHLEQGMPMAPQHVWGLRQLKIAERMFYRNELAAFGQDMLALGSRHAAFQESWTSIVSLSDELIAKEKMGLTHFFENENYDHGSVKPQLQEKWSKVQTEQEGKVKLVVQPSFLQDQSATTQIAPLGPVGSVKRGAGQVDAVTPAPVTKRARVLVNLTRPDPTPVQPAPVQPAPQPAPVAPQPLTPAQQATKAERELKAELSEVIYTQWKADIDTVWGMNAGNLPSAKPWERVPYWLSTRGSDARWTARGMQHILDMGRAAPGRPAADIIAENFDEYLSKPFLVCDKNGDIVGLSRPRVGGVSGAVDTAASTTATPASSITAVPVVPVAPVVPYTGSEDVHNDLTWHLHGTAQDVYKCSHTHPKCVAKTCKHDCCKEGMTRSQKKKSLGKQNVPRPLQVPAVPTASATTAAPAASQSTVAPAAPATPAVTTAPAATAATAAPMAAAAAERMKEKKVNFTAARTIAVVEEDTEEGDGDATQTVGTLDPGFSQDETILVAGVATYQLANRDPDSDEENGGSDASDNEEEAEADSDGDRVMSDVEDETDGEFDDEAEPEADVDDDTAYIQAQLQQSFEDDVEQAHAPSSPNVEVSSEYEDDADDLFEDDEAGEEPQEQAPIVQMEEVASEEAANDDSPAVDEQLDEEAPSGQNDEDDDFDDLFGDRELQEEAAVAANGVEPPEDQGEAPSRVRKDRVRIHLTAIDEAMLIGPNRDGEVPGVYACGKNRFSYLHSLDQTTQDP